MLQPYWSGGLAWGFFVTLGCTVLEIVTAHLLPQAATHELLTPQRAGEDVIRMAREP